MWYKWGSGDFAEICFGRQLADCSGGERLSIAGTANCDQKLQQKETVVGERDISCRNSAFQGGTLTQKTGRNKEQKLLTVLFQR